MWLVFFKQQIWWLQKIWQQSDDSIKDMIPPLIACFLSAYPWAKLLPGVLCVQNVSIFLTSGEKLHCVPLLAYANATGECRSCGSAARAPAAGKLCGESFSGSQKPISSSSAEDGEEFRCSLERRLCFSPDGKINPELMLPLVWEVITVLPWHLGWLVGSASPGREQIKKN